MGLEHQTVELDHKESVEPRWINSSNRLGWEEFFRREVAQGRLKKPGTTLLSPCTSYFEPGMSVRERVERSVFIYLDGR
jgi:hypothetical protein